jgi:manganese transport system permease protein
LRTDRSDRMLIIAVTAAVSSTVLGIIASYHIDASTGACIVLVQTLLFLSTLLFAPKYGIAKRQKT